jgi:hypothetical protein
MIDPRLAVAAAAEPTSMTGSGVERNGSAMEGQGSAAEGDDSIWEVTMMKVATVKKAEPKCGPYGSDEGERRV